MRNNFADLDSRALIQASTIIAGDLERNVEHGSRWMSEIDEKLHELERRRKARDNKSEERNDSNTSGNMSPIVPTDAILSTTSRDSANRSPIDKTAKNKSDDRPSSLPIDRSTGAPTKTTRHQK